MRYNTNHRIGAVTEKDTTMSNFTRHDITDETQLHDYCALPSSDIAQCDCDVLTRAEVIELGYEDPQHDRYVIVRDTQRNIPAIVAVQTVH